MVPVFSFTSRKRQNIIFQLSTVKPPPPKKVHHTPEAWCGSQREMGGLLEFHDQIPTQNFSALHHDAWQSALARGRRRLRAVVDVVEAWDDGRTGAQEAENGKWRGWSCECGTTVMSGSFWANFCEGCDGNTLWFQGKTLSDINVVSFWWTNLPHE